MDKELLFAKTLEDLKNNAKEQGNCIAEKQIQAAFTALELNTEQIELVKDYLIKNKIGIGEPVNLDDYLTKEEINYLDTYLEELELQNKLSEGEKEAVTLSAMAGEKQAQALLIQTYLPEVVGIAKLYGGQGVLLEDLIGEGNVALSLGVTMLGCLEQAKEAESMLVKMIMDAMEEYIAENLKEVKADQIALDKVNKVAGRAKELAETLRRKVTMEELSKESGISENIIREAIRISGGQIEEIEFWEGKQSGECT